MKRHNTDATPADIALESEYPKPVHRVIYDLIKREQSESNQFGPISGMPAATPGWCDYCGRSVEYCDEDCI